MSFPRYPTYKDSGAAWLGEVPQHWGVGSVRWLCRRYSGGTPDKTNLAYWDEGTIPWLNSGAVNDRIIEKPSTYITAEAFANSSTKWVPEGALVVALAGQGKTKGMVAQLAIPSTCNQSMAAIVPGSKIVAKFLFWWLESNYQNIRNMAGGDLRDGLNLELLGNVPCPLAPLSEQTHRLLPRGTVVIGMIGQGKTRGLAASLEIEASINQNLAAIIPGNNLTTDYLLYIFQSAYEFLREFGRGGNQAALNCEILSAVKVPLPPVQEQLQICEYLCVRLMKFDTLSAEAQRAIDLLQERRTALITAAVTGQIDVRELTKAKAA